MSKLSEYLALVPKGLKNIGKIADGIRNDLRMEYGKLPQEVEDIIIHRRLICADCPFNSINAKAAGWYATSRDDDHCTMCGCPIDIRTAALEANCGIEDYNEQIKNIPDRSPLELKWTKKED